MNEVSELDLTKFKTAGQWLDHKHYPTPAAVPVRHQGLDYYCCEDVERVWNVRNKHRAPFNGARAVDKNKKYFWLTDTELCRSKSYWEKLGRKLVDGAKPYAKVSCIGNTKGWPIPHHWEVYRESSTTAKRAYTKPLADEATS